MLIFLNPVEEVFFCSEATAGQAATSLMQVKISQPDEVEQQSISHKLSQKKFIRKDEIRGLRTAFQSTVSSATPPAPDCFCSNNGQPVTPAGRPVGLFA